MNKQKQKAIVPLYSDYEDKLWWQYVEYNEHQNLQFEDFFKKNAKDLPNYITNDFFQTLNNIHKLIGLKPHPVLAEEPLYFQENHGNKNNGQISQEDIGQIQIQNNNAPSSHDLQESKNLFLLFQNVRVDQLSLRILQLILPNFNNLCALKFCNNNFSQQSCHLLLQLLNQPTSPISKLFFEWNPLRQDLMNSFIPALQILTFLNFQIEFHRVIFVYLYLIYQPRQGPVIRNYLYQRQQMFSFNKRGQTHLEFLVLRSCQINDDILVSLVENFKLNPNLKIKYLELYNNNIRGEGIKVLGQLMEKYQKFEYIGLAKNGIQNLENLKDIFNAIGKKVLNQEELAFYREKEKEKEQIIQKATKNKKRITEDMYPHLDPIVQLPDGCISLIEFYLEQFAIVRNTQIKMLNLSMNNINEAESEQLEKFLVNVTEDLQIVLYHNNFEGKHKERLKKKYRKNIQI